MIFTGANPVEITTTRHLIFAGLVPIVIHVITVPLGYFYVYNSSTRRIVTRTVTHSLFQDGMTSHLIGNADISPINSLGFKERGTSIPNIYLNTTYPRTSAITIRTKIIDAHVATEGELILVDRSLLVGEDEYGHNEITGEYAMRLTGTAILNGISSSKSQTIVVKVKAGT